MIALLSDNTVKPPLSIPHSLILNLFNPIPFGLFCVLILSGGGQNCPPLEFMYKIDQISFLGLVFCRIPSIDPLS